MNMKQKTAMQQLVEQLEDFGVFSSKISPASVIVAINKLLPVEKEQITDAFTAGNRLDTYDGTEEAGEQYFNETFKTTPDGDK